MYVDMKYIFMPLIYFPRFDDFKLRSKRILATKEFDLFFSNWLTTFESLIYNLQLTDNFKFRNINTNFFLNQYKYIYKYLSATTYQINNNGLKAYFVLIQDTETSTYNNLTHTLLLNI